MNQDSNDDKIQEEEKRNEKTEQLEHFPDNLSSNSLNMNEFNSIYSFENQIKQELQPIKVLKSPLNKIDFRLTPIYEYFQNNK